MSIRIIAASVFLLLGIFVFSVSVLGLFRFKNVLDRMHAAALGDTMGIFFTVTGLVILSDNFNHGIKLIFVVVFIWLTSPVATHLIGKIELLTANKDYVKRRSIK